MISEKAVEAAFNALADQVATHVEPHHMRAALSAALPLLLEGKREEIAREIDPRAFHQWEEMRLYCIRQRDGDEEARATADWAHGKEKNDAYAKADRVLAIMGGGE